MLSERVKKVKEWVFANEKDLLLGFIIILVSVIGFSLGRISALNERRYPIGLENENLSPIDQKIGKGSSGDFVASKNGATYYLVTCPGAGRIKNENKIYFSSAEDARKAGYRPAANCPGL